MIRVMIVDDYPYMRFGLRELLNAEADIEVVAECADGQEAVELAGHLRPDVVLTDLKMPGLDGAEATAAARERPRRGCGGALRRHLTASWRRATVAGAHAVPAKNLDGSLVVAAVRAAAACARRPVRRGSVGMKPSGCGDAPLDT